MAADITQVGEDVARAFWEQQDDARIFLHPDVLGPLCVRVDWWLASWNGDPVCLWPVCHAADGTHRPPELSAYVGPLWHDTVSRNKPHRWWTITRETQHAFIRFLAERYGSFAFELPPGSRDVRVFQWFSEEVSPSTRVQISCRHTAILHRPSTDLADSVAAGFARNRLADLRGRKSRTYQEWMDPAADALLDLYSGLLGGKNDADKAIRRDLEVRGLVSLAQAGFGEVIAYCDADGMPASFSLQLKSKRTALQLLIASTDQARRDGLQAAVQLQAMLRSFDAGATSFDFVGGNSTSGAEEKHRYGGWPEMYFRIAVMSP